VVTFRFVNLLSKHDDRVTHRGNSLKKTITENGTDEFERNTIFKRSLLIIVHQYYCKRGCLGKKKLTIEERESATHTM